MDPLSDTTRTWRLAAGEQRMLRVSAGSRWIVARGEACLIEPPRWLGDRLVGIQLVLHDGAEHRIEHGGWVSLQARGDCAVICATRRPVVERLKALWRMMRPGRAVRAPA